MLDMRTGFVVSSYGCETLMVLCLSMLIDIGPGIRDIKRQEKHALKGYERRIFTYRRESK